MASVLTRALALLGCFCVAASAQAAPARVDVVVVGAGLSGLATAYGLKKAGLSFRILELSPRVGGRVRTVQYHDGGAGEAAADSGMEEYWESNPAVGLLHELKLPLRSDVALSSMVLEGKLEPLGSESGPEYARKLLGRDGFEALESFKSKYAPLIRRLHDTAAAGAPLDADTMRLKDVSFAKFVAERNLPRRASEWIRVSVECEAGSSWDRISALDGLAEMHIFLGEGEKSYRVIGGNERFTDRLAQAVGRDRIRLNARVNRVVSKDGQVTVHYLDQARNTSESIQASYVVSTIPLFRLFEVQFEPALSVKKREAISSQGWGSYFKAHILLPASAAARWTRGEASILPVLSDSDLGVLYDGNPDQGGRKVLSLLTYGSHAEAFNLMPLDQVRAQITASLDRLWPGIAGEIQGIEFYRYHPRAVAAWPPGRSRFDALSAALREPENGVILAGDFTESSHSDGAFISARRAVAQIQTLRRQGAPLAQKKETARAPKPSR